MKLALWFSLIFLPALVVIWFGAYFGWESILNEWYGFPSLITAFILQIGWAGFCGYQSYG